MFSPLRLQQICILGMLLAFVPSSNHQLFAADGQDEWRRIVEAAKKKAKSSPAARPPRCCASNSKETFESRFGIELELLSAPGPQNAQRAIAEFKAGVKHFDVLHGGSGTLQPAAQRQHARAVYGLCGSP